MVWQGKNRRINRSFEGFAIVAVGAIAVVALFPFYWMGVTSVLPENTIFRYPPSFLPMDGEIKPYLEVLTASDLPRWILNSSFIVFTSTILSVFVSTLAAYSLSRYGSRMGITVGYVLLASRMVPSTLWVIPLYLLYQSLGILNTYTSLILAYTSFEIPFATWMLKGYFDSIPRELEQAAQIDGCSEWQALFAVILPLSLPGLAASLIASAVLGWSDYLFALTFLRDKSLWTITVGIQSFFGEHVTHWNHIMASSLLATLPLLVVFIVLGRFLVGGLTAGAVKR
jgi:multiple sugar transport system permease protein